MEGDGLSLEHSEGDTHDDCVRPEDTGAARLGGAGMDLHPWDTQVRRKEREGRMNMEGEEFF